MLLGFGIFNTLYEYILYILIENIMLVEHCEHKVRSFSVVVVCLDLWENSVILYFQKYK